VRLSAESRCARLEMKIGHEAPMGANRMIFSAVGATSL
jgi:hypothetical protein